jgi:hypothetical protein
VAAFIDEFKLKDFAAKIHALPCDDGVESFKTLTETVRPPTHQPASAKISLTLLGCTPLLSLLCVCASRSLAFHAAWCLVVYVQDLKRAGWREVIPSRKFLKAVQDKLCGPLLSQALYQNDGGRGETMGANTAVYINDSIPPPANRVASTRPARAASGGTAPARAASGGLGGAIKGRASGGDAAPPLRSRTQRGGKAPQKLVKPPSQYARRVVALYDFVSNRDERHSFVAGDKFRVLDDNKMWWVAKNQAGQIARIPSNYMGE